MDLVTRVEVGGTQSGDGGTQSPDSGYQSDDGGYQSESGGINQIYIESPTEYAHIIFGNIIRFSGIIQSQSSSAYS